MADTLAARVESAVRYACQPSALADLLADVAAADRLAAAADAQSIAIEAWPTMGTEAAKLWEAVEEQADALDAYRARKGVGRG